VEFIYKHLQKADLVVKEVERVKLDKARIVEILEEQI